MADSHADVVPIMSRLFRLRRNARTIHLLCRLAPLLRRQFRDQGNAGPVLVITVLQDLGGAWAKLGQALAMRSDLLPERYCKELMTLLNQMKPFPFDAVRDILRSELGDDWERRFTGFEPDPFAAASIGQVHRATLRNGERVAVKVQRPGIEQIIAADIHLMYRVARLLDRRELLGATRCLDVIREFERWTLDELDFTIEARHAKTLGEQARDDYRERSPTVYDDFTKKRVLTTSLLEGIPLLTIVQALKALQGQDRTDYCQKLASHGCRLDRIAQNLLWNTLNQVFQQGYFHADLHPANLYVMPDNVIGYVDFGIIGRLHESQRNSLAYYALHLFLGDVEGSVQEFMRWVTPSEQTDLKLAREEIYRIAEGYVSKLRHSSDGKVQGGWEDYQNKTFQVVVKHKLSISPRIVLTFRALITAITTIYTLCPDYDLRRDVNRFFARMVQEDAKRLFDPGSIIRQTFDLGVRAQRALGQFDSPVQAERQGRTVISKVRRRLRTISLQAIAIVSGLYLLKAQPVIRFFDVAPERLEVARLILGLALAVLAVRLVWTIWPPSKDDA